MNRPQDVTRRVALSLLGALFAAGCASANPESNSEERTGSQSEAVDLSAYSNDGGVPQIEVVQDNSVASQATGVVFVPFRDPTTHAQTFVSSAQYGNLPVRGSCGVTFVSPHYAITSAHCFADANAYDPITQTFTVQTFNVSTANVDDFYFDSAMMGTFPNYKPTFGQTMSQAAGYVATTFSCKIASRCPGAVLAEPTSAFNCDSVNAPDIAMLQCSSRPVNAAWLPIANDQATEGSVVLYWFHELFMTNNNPDMIAHYTNLSLSNRKDNWHYLGAPTNQFLPFKSVVWGDGRQRRRIGPGADHDVATDLYGCHGTSGSGVLVPTANGLALLGPAHAGGSAWGANHLCDDPGALLPGAPNGHGLTFNSNASVNALVNAKYGTILANDRHPAPACGDGICNGTETHANCPKDCGVGDCSINSGTSDCCADGVCRTAVMCSKLHCL